MERHRSKAHNSTGENNALILCIHLCGMKFTVTIFHWYIVLLCSHQSVQPPIGHHHRAMPPNHFPPNQPSGDYTKLCFAIWILQPVLWPWCLQFAKHLAPLPFVCTGPMSMQPYDVYGLQQGNKKPIGMNAFYPNNYYQNQGNFYPKTDS